MDWDLIIVIVVIGLAIALGIGIKFFILWLTKKGIDKIKRNSDRKER